MQFYARNSVVDVDLYEERLNRTQEIYVDLVGVGMYSQQQLCKAATLHRLCLRHMNLHSKLGYSALDTSSVTHYLQNVEKIDPKNFRKKDVQGASLDKKKVLEPLYKNGYAPDFLELYMSHQESKSRGNNMAALYKRLVPNEKIKGWEEMLTAVPFTAGKDVNLRFSYSSENLISLPRDMRGVIKAPEGYVLAWGDFKQSDARIAYNLLLRDETNIKYINAFPDDIYAGFANWVREFQREELERQLAAAIQFRADVYAESGVEPGLASVDVLQQQLAEWQPFKGFLNTAERNIYKVHVLETIYGTRHHRVSKSAGFIATLGRVLDSCPKYKRYWEDITKRASFGIPLRVKCFMGHIEYVPAFDGSRVNDTRNKCLNYPVQGGTSEIMIVTVNRLLDMFYTMGYTEDDIGVYYIRHDEPVFVLKKSLMQDSWVFRDFEHIQVEDWTPLGMEFSFGRVYTIEDIDLMGEYNLSVKINKSKLTSVSPKKTAEDYYPLPNLLEVAIHIEHISDTETVVAIYDATNKTGVAKCIATSSDQTDTVVVQRMVEKYLRGIYEAGYRQIVVNNKSLAGERLEGEVPVSQLYRISSDPDMYRAMLIALAAGGARDGTLHSIVEENRDFLMNLPKNRLFGGGQNTSA